MPSSKRPEILAPAGDRACLEAAVAAGADAVYFGLPGFNARARAKNFDAAELGSTLTYLHDHGRKGYVTLNTLVFDDELVNVEAAVRACAAAGVDAVIVQDLGVAELVRAIAPTLPIHASTQMTCTDAASVELARSLGAERVILARELSLDDIAELRKATAAELEVFVHGALCISYSGQCLTSEAIGGRSANRGACAQACRLPYELVVDGALRDLADRAFLLSPEDLEASALVPKLVELGVASLKIEGRLKGPEYVAATTALYRSAVDAVFSEGSGATEERRNTALQMFSRGSGPGFLGGTDHQRLVEARSCDHRGLLLGTLSGTATSGGKEWLQVALTSSVARGDGILVEGGAGGKDELGGRVWAIDGEGTNGSTARLWLGPDVSLARVASGSAVGRRIFATSRPVQEKEAREIAEQSPRARTIDLVIRGRAGAPFVLEAQLDGHGVRIEGDAEVTVATGRGLDLALAREKLGQLGETSFTLGELTLDLPERAFIPPSSLKRARRALVDALLVHGRRLHTASTRTAAEIVASSPLPEVPPPPAGLFALCRSEAQARAALDAGAAGVYLDFLELTGTGAAFRALRSDFPRAVLGVAPPRIRKPKEEKIDAYLASLAPDAVLVRGLGALYELAAAARRTAAPLAIADFSLNATNTLTARALLRRGAAAFVPAFDLDAAQLVRLLSRELAPFAEVVVHHPMPLFHMEHCAIAALLSEGRDHKTCGRPCERHQVSLRDRAGMDHPVEADVGCRNTVFHARAQSAADVVPALARAGVRRFRIELVRETAEDSARIVGTYRRLLAGELEAPAAWRALKTESGYGVVRGSLRIVEA
jgi:putative protease